MMKQIFAILLAILLMAVVFFRVPEKRKDPEPATAPESLTEPEPATTSGTAPAIEAGKITVVSNGETYEPLMNFMCSATCYNGGFIMADGRAMFADKETLRREAFDTLDAIPYADDFQIILKGSYATAETTFKYEIYDDSLKLISSGASLDGIDLPAGVSLLYIEANWRRGEEYSIHTYDFKISR